MKIILNGIQLGVVLAFLVGPVFFSIIQTSVEKGFWKGSISTDLTASYPSYRDFR